MEDGETVAGTQAPSRLAKLFTSSMQRGEDLRQDYEKTAVQEPKFGGSEARGHVRHNDQLAGIRLPRAELLWSNGLGGARTTPRDSAASHAPTQES